MRTARAAILALACSAHAVAADVTRSDFAYGMQLQATTVAPLYRVSLPLDVYQQAVRPDLGDIRVLNGDGEIVPYALRRATGDIASTAVPVPLAVFPLRGVTLDPGASVRLQMGVGSTSVQIERSASAGAAQAIIFGYLLDARALARSMSVLDLGWATDAADFSTRVQLESSDDLSQWRKVAEAPVINLHYGGQQFQQARIAFAPTSAKFLRLSWIGTPPAATLTSVMATPATDRVDVRRQSISARGHIAAGTTGDYEFDLGANVPLDRVNLDLPEVNTVVTADFDTRAEPTAQWRPVGHARLYRLQTGDGAQIANPPLALPVTTSRYWRVRVSSDGGGLGSGLPVLSGGWLPDDVLFVARGRPPFELVYGSGAAGPASLPVQNLKVDLPDAGASHPQIDVGAATLAARTLIGGPDRLKPRHPQIQYRVVLLWALLILGVALMAWMAWQLSRKLPATDEHTR